MAGKNKYTFESKIHVYRATKRMTQQELADQVGVSRQTIRQLERNRYNPSMLLAYSIAKVFDVTIEDLFDLVPFSTITTELKKEVTLQIPYSEIKSVEITEDMLNYQIAIITDTDTIRLTAQQKELSGFRSTGMLAFYNDGLKVSNWHKENLDGTLKMLSDIAK